jgi:hypothetical protein
MRDLGHQVQNHSSPDYMYEDSVSAQKNGFHLEVQVPPNTRATVTVPSGRGDNGVETSDPVDVGSGYHEWFVSVYKEP